MANGFSIDSGIPDVDRLLSRGGMDSMLLTIWLILGAVTFGAMLEEFGLISRLVDPMIAAATSTGRLFLTVFACGFGLNVVAGDQYIALVLPSRIFRAEFAKPRPGADQPVAAGRRQRHRDLAAGAVELLRRVHGRRPWACRRCSTCRTPSSATPARRSACCTASPVSRSRRSSPPSSRRTA